MRTVLPLIFGLVGCWVTSASAQSVSGIPSGPMVVPVARPAILTASAPVAGPSADALSSLINSMIAPAERPAPPAPPAAIATPGTTTVASIDPQMPIALFEPMVIPVARPAVLSLPSPAPAAAATAPPVRAAQPAPTVVVDHAWVNNALPFNSRNRTQRRCLAAAIYFEARGEPIRGQQAVAQVILNRVKNPAYPDNICDVVYQNDHMYNACQFSFACDGIRDEVTEPDAWAIAEDIAWQATRGNMPYLTDVGSSTHYHATYVHPSWADEMQQMVKIGVHIFYRTYGGGWI